MTTDGVYARAAKKVEDNLWKFRGMRFTTRDMQNACSCVMPERDPDKQHQDYRDAVTRYLYEQSDQQKKNKRPQLRLVSKRFYELINRDRTALVLPTTLPVPLPFTWPLDVDTGLELPFASDIIVEPGDIIGLWGESNRGKTAICTNIAVENAIRDRPVTMWISEWHPTQLQRRLLQYPGALNGTGQPVFKMFKLELADIVDQIAEEPDSIHILDWVNMKDRFWDIAGLQERIVEALGKGVAVIAGQKMEGKEYGIGGQWGDFNTSVSMTVSRLGEGGVYNRMKLNRVKSPREGAHIEKTSYRFKVVKVGARIAEVDEIKDCRSCFATGQTKKGPCDRCEGEGYTLIARPSPPPMSRPADKDSPAPVEF